MNYYICAKLGEQHLHRNVDQFRLLMEQHGHRLTYDPAKNQIPKPYDHRPDIASRESIHMLRAVMASDFIILFCHEKMIGGYIELGCALAINILFEVSHEILFGSFVRRFLGRMGIRPKRIFVIGGESDLGRSTFFYLPRVERKGNINEAITDILRKD